MHQIGLPYHWGRAGRATGDSVNDLQALALDPNVHISESKAATCDIAPGAARAVPRWSSSSRHTTTGKDRSAAEQRRRWRARPSQLEDELERLRAHTHSWPGSYGEEARPRMGFFTDTSVCIGCKACEVACKEWNEVPEDGLRFTGNSYDNTGHLSADTWRHVAFIEQRQPVDVRDAPMRSSSRQAGASPSARPSCPCRATRACAG